MGASTLAVLGATYTVPWLWNRIKSMIDQGMKRVKDGLQYVKCTNTFFKHAETHKRLFCNLYD